ncbi:hypothetical protein QQX09_10135 [Demequina sp. SYSU T00192]|uniref:Uncharacterized protein n=1 Tax=Demequina litoralis TaxID=3051660 RepID=A0ABT8GB64_9MICO|nr:hypothetical protein [Demequina sp. SYSU T00192]MDN4476212.1 hypothetical protein [Demequina sp. SYSU T00192]
MRGPGMVMAAAVTAATAAALLAGCTAADAPGASSAPTVTPTCPDTIAPEPGTPETAAAAPEIGAFDSAWLCVYALGDAWTLAEGPAPIDDLDGVRELVDALEPADLMRPCTLELGPEYLLTLADGDDLTRIVVDAYGCRWARVEGEPGLLTGPDTIIADLDGLAGL